MDILFWTKLNPDILVKKVSRAYYNKYYFKLEIDMVGSSFLRYPDRPLETQAADRQLLARRINYAGSWRNNLKVPSADEIQKFSAMIDTMASDLELTRLDAIIHHCNESGLELEVASTLISRVLKEKIREESVTENLLKKTSTLPI